MMSPVAQAVLLACMLSPFVACSDTVVTARDGAWSDPAVWNGGAMPGPLDDIIVNHSVIVAAGMTVEVTSLTVNGELTVAPASTLQLAGVAPFLQVGGVLECADGSVLAGTTAENTTFRSGSRYVHRQGPLGFVPLATWEDGSTFQISGFVDDGYINLAHSAGWRQSFGHVEYNCPAQTVFIVDLNGHLRDVRGDLVIRNTNLKALRLSTTQRAVIHIGGNLIIEGPSQVWFSTNSPDCVINVGGDVLYRSQAAAASYLSTRGNIRLAIGGSLVIDAPGPLRMASSAADSTGTRQSAVSLKGDFSILRGSIVAPPAGSGDSVIEFSGTEVQQVDVPRVATLLYGNLHYVVAAGARVALGESPLFSESGTLTVSGTLEAGSTDGGGAIQTGTAGGNIRVPGNRSFAAGSVLIYNGRGHQVIGNGHPSAPHTRIDNADGVSLSADVRIRGDFHLAAGAVSQAGYTFRVEGDVSFSTDDAAIESLTLEGGANQIIEARGGIIERLEVAKASGTVSLTSALRVSGVLQFVSAVLFESRGFLTLLSTGDDAGSTASVGAIPPGASVSGDVRVERYMSGEGRIYRYLSSPVSNASVASLMDDFPVTGTFDNPSVGEGIRSGNPSLFMYDESLGEDQRGWVGYPGSGAASAAPLRAGRGYAAFIRNVPATVVDFTGPINQGDIHLPLGYTVHNGTGNGWHLVGNPYPSAIDWDAAALSKVALSRVIAIRDNGERRFRYWDGDDDGDIADGRIAAGQSFWVRAMGAGASLTIREQAKSVDAAFYRRSVGEVPSLVISVSDGRVKDRTVVKLRPRSRSGLDDWDGVKLLNDSLNLSTVLAKGIRLAIDCRPAVPDTIPLFITDLYPSRYFIQITGSGYLSDSIYCLVDHYRRRVFELHAGDSVEFEVTGDSASSGARRFTLYMRRPVENDSCLVTGPRLTDVLDSLASMMPSLQQMPSVQKTRVVQTTGKAGVVRGKPLSHGGTEGSLPPGSLLAIKNFYPNPVRSCFFIEGTFAGTTVTDVRESIALFSVSGLQVSPERFVVYQDDPVSGNGGTNVAKSSDTSGRTSSQWWVVDVTWLPPGAYLVRINIGGRTAWTRFIKE